MAVLDDIIKIDVLTDETINSDFTSEPLDIGKAERYAIVFSYVNGSSVDMMISLEASVDGVNFGQYEASEVQITDNDGSISYDVYGSSAVFIRFKVVHTSGSIDASIFFSGKRNH